MLEQAHGRGLHVGDLRSRKVYQEADQVRLTDLGLARASCLAAGFGRHGIPFGHPAYLAPEVVQDELTTPSVASDLYLQDVELWLTSLEVHGVLDPGGLRE